MKTKRANRTNKQNGTPYFQRVLLSLFCTLVLSIDLWADQAFDRQGIAFVDSLDHQPQYRFRESNSSLPLKVHQTLSFAEPFELSTDSKDHVFIKFSNHVTLGLMENTSLSIEQFRQAAFESVTINNHREPSKSFFKARLKAGTILVKTGKFSPLSTFEIELPVGTLEFHAAECVIEYRYNILTIALYQGNISLIPKADQGTPLLLSAPSYYTSDHYDLERGLIRPSQALTKAPQRWIHYPDFLRIVNQRVQFIPMNEGSETVAEARILIEKNRFDSNSSKQAQQP